MLKIACYRNWAEVEELRPSWNLLLSSSASDTVFITWEWMSAWWTNYCADRELLVLAAWEDNELKGIAPFYLDRVQLYGREWRRLCLIGDGSHDSDYLDCFAEKGREAEVMGAFFQALESDRKSWDWIELNGPAKDSPHAVSALQYAREKNWKFEVEPIRCAFLPLPKNWDDYLRNLQPRFRTKVRSSLTLLEEYLKSAPVQCSAMEQIDEWLPTLFDLHTRRWGLKNQQGVFHERAKRAFYRDLSRAAFEQGWLAFHRLDCGERPLACQFGVVYKNRFHLLQEGYDPEFSAIRPGVALRAWLMRHWIEAGLAHYDFLAGVSDHKLDWGAQERLATRLRIAARRVSVFVSFDLPRVNVRMRESIRQLTPAPLVSLRKRILTWRARRGSALIGVVPEATSSVSGIARQLVSAAYSATGIAKLGRSVASNYVWETNANSLSFRRRSRPVCHILQYHRVNDDCDPYLGGLPVETFRAQMQYFAANFPFLTLDQIASGEFPGGYKYYLAVTFDDGYRDNFTCAFPILRQLGIPATIFLATGYIDSGRLPWYDRVRLAFKLTTRSQFVVAGVSRKNLSNCSQRLQCMEQTLQRLRALPDSERQSMLIEIFHALGVSSGLNLPNQMLRWDDVRQMAQNKVSFGAHTVTHPVLSRISVPQLEGEILGSKRAIENRLQLPVWHFAYPFGQTFDVGVQAKQSVRKAGFRTASTTVWGLNEPNDDLFELKRFSPWESNLAEFKLKLDWYRFRVPTNKDASRAAESMATNLAGEVGV